MSDLFALGDDGPWTFMKLSGYAATMTFRDHPPEVGAMYGLRVESIEPDGSVRLQLVRIEP